MNSLFAQESGPSEPAGEFLPERPGFAVPAAPVGFGMLQLENGNAFEWATQQGAKLHTLTTPGGLLRFGLTKSLELRVTASGYAWQTAWLGGQRTTPAGAGEYNIGAKYRLLAQSEGRPEISLVGSISLPARGSAFTSPRHDPAFTLAATKDLPHGVSVIANANFASVSDNQGRIFSSGECLWLTKTMKPVSVFVEGFHTTIGRDMGSEMIFDGGFYRNIAKFVQVDIEAGHTVSGLRPSLFLSAGMVIRGPQAFLGPNRYRFGH